MKTAASLAVLQALAVQAIRIIHGNDDGWAESYVRIFDFALINNGHDVVLSAPAENKSGTGAFLHIYPGDMMQTGPGTDHSMLTSSTRRLH
jgi:broad specificity polyphosphatase/5'/3'-nucleotidase SurE